MGLAGLRADQTMKKERSPMQQARTKVLVPALTRTRKRPILLALGRRSRERAIRSGPPTGPTGTPAGPIGSTGPIGPKANQTKKMRKTKPLTKASPTK